MNEKEFFDVETLRPMLTEHMMKMHQQGFILGATGAYASIRTMIEEGKTLDEIAKFVKAKMDKYGVEEANK